MDGIRNVYHTTHYVDLVNKGSSLIPDFWIPVPERFFLPEQRERLYVPGSQSARINIAGDIVGPVLSRTNPSLFSARGFWGRGPTILDPYMFRITYNVLMLKYLRLTNQLESDVLQASLSAMRRGSIKKDKIKLYIIAVFSNLPEIISCYAYINSDGGARARKGTVKSDIC